MRKFQFSKLVRGKIVDQMKERGAKPNFHHLDKSAHAAELVRKIGEEAAEILTAPQAKLASELADVQQALDDLRQLMGVSGSTLKREQQAKKQAAGDFSQGVFIQSVQVNDDDPWMGHYLANPERYPEVS